MEDPPFRARLDEQLPAESQQRHRAAYGGVRTGPPDGRTAEQWCVEPRGDSRQTEGPGTRRALLYSP